MEASIMTPWQIAGVTFGLVVSATAWTWGGRLERFAAGVMLIDFMVTSITFNWHIGGFFLATLVQDGVRLLIFGWLCFQSNRWWPFIVTTALAMAIFMHGAGVLNPAVSHFALASAHVGLEYLINLALLLGVLERWLAGERPVGPAAWAKAARATVARRDRRDEARRPEAGPALNRNGVT